MKHKILSFVALLTVIILYFTGCEKDDADHDSHGITTHSDSSQINGLVINAGTLRPISRAMVLLLDEAGTVTLDQIHADPNGKFNFSHMLPGVYHLKVQQTGYQEMISGPVTIGSGNPEGNFVALCPAETGLTKSLSAISGIVLNESSNPVAGASVSVSGDPEEQTNGYFSSVQTNSDGQFFIPAIPLNSAGNTPITSFRIRIMKDGFVPYTEVEIYLARNELTVMNFLLSHPAGNVPVLFSENFDSVTPWIFSGFWHRHETSTSSNSAYPDYVKAGLNDKTEGALPAAHSGQFTAWYGQESTANYLGAPEPGQASLSGGTSVAENHGRMISPPIQLTTTTGQPVLSFWTWYEVESRNPGPLGNDHMDVLVYPGGDTTQPVLITRLNPAVDPLYDNRDAIPFTSGGFDQAPVWTYREYSLEAFSGQTIRLGFNFETVDVYSNGFRGWFVDDIRISGGTR